MREETTADTGRVKPTREQREIQTGGPQLYGWPESRKGLTVVDPRRAAPSRELLQALPGSVLRKHRALPLALRDSTLVLGLENPSDPEALDVFRRLTGWEILPVQLAFGGGELPEGSELSGSETARCIPLEMLECSWEVGVLGPLLWARCTQRFRNSTAQRLEGTYQVPLPATAVIQSLWGQSQQSRDLLSMARMSLRDGQTWLTARTGPLEPGEVLHLGFDFVQLLREYSGQARIWLPCPSEAVPLQIRVQVRAQDVAPSSIRCSHLASWHRREELLEVEVREEVSEGQHFEMSFVETPREARCWSDGQHFLLQLGPVLPPALPTARDFLFLIDHSASMEECNSQLAWQALKVFLSQMRPLDRFRVACFDTRTVAWNEGKPELANHQEAALDWLASQPGGSGVSQLTQALAWLAQVLPPRGQRDQQVVVLLSDGQFGGPSEHIKSLGALHSRMRFFCLGLGPRADEALLSQLASSGGGSIEICQDRADLDSTVYRLIQQFEGLALTQLRVVGQGFHADPHHQVPRQLQGLFFGQRLHVWGKHQGMGSLSISGLTPGEPRSYNVQPQRTNHPALATLWARARCRYLENLFNDADAQQAQQLGDQLLQIRREYGLSEIPQEGLVPPDSPSARLEKILQQTFLQGVSHVHLEAGQVRTRYFGRLGLAGEMPPALLPSLLALLRRRCGLGEASGGVEQGHFERHGTRVEVSFCPTVAGEKAVLTLHHRPRQLTSGLRGSSQILREALLGHRRGMILVCGPRGTGVTRTMIEWLVPLTRRKRIGLLHHEPWFGLEGVCHLGQEPNPSLSSFDMVVCTRPKGAAVWESLREAAHKGALVLVRQPARSGPQAQTLLRAQGQDLDRCLLASFRIQRVPLLCDCKQVVDDPAVLQLLPAGHSYFTRRGCGHCRSQGYRSEATCLEIHLPEPDLRLHGPSLEQQLLQLAWQGLLDVRDLIS